MIYSIDKCCYFNKMIDCDKHDKCNHCGWNPDVAKERIDKVMEERINKGLQSLSDKKYQVMKARARDKAIEWQYDFENHNYSYSELAYWCDYFYNLGKRYGLLREFHENGIC